jgi:hypothetical protein
MLLTMVDAVNLVAQVQAVFQSIVLCHATLLHYLADQLLLYVLYCEIREAHSRSLLLLLLCP